MDYLEQMIRAGGKASGRTYGSFPTGNAGRLKE